MADARGVGSTLADIRTRSAKRAKQANRGCPLLALLDRHADIRTLVLRPANLGLVMLWRLKCVSRTWGAWVTAAMLDMGASLRVAATETLNVHTTLLVAETVGAAPTQMVGAPARLLL